MLTDLARHLRQNSTEAETRLWNLLRSRQLSGYRFLRQHPIGKYIADFACTKYRIVIEADGGQHADSASDAVRDAYLKGNGWHILRFWNNEILTNSDGVLFLIEQSLKKFAAK